MQIVRCVARFAIISAAGFILAACAGQKEPAAKLIGDIEATTTAASAEAGKYVPDQLAVVQRELGTLKGSFDQQDYAAVMTQGPSVLAEAKALATEAAGKKDEILKALNEEWASLSGILPGELTAIQNRVDSLGKKSAKQMAAGMDLAAAKNGLADVGSLWSKAQGAFASGNMEEAVNTAKDVRARADSLATSLKLDLPAPAAGARAAPSR